MHDRSIAVQFVVLNFLTNLLSLEWRPLLFPNPAGETPRLLPGFLSSIPLRRHCLSPRNRLGYLVHGSNGTSLESLPFRPTQELISIRSLVVIKPSRCATALFFKSMTWWIAESKNKCRLIPSLLQQPSIMHYIELWCISLRSTSHTWAFLITYPGIQ